MWELDCEESWTLKNWCFWTVVLEKTLESPLDCKEIQPVRPKGDQSWVFTGRTDVEAETPILWPPHAKSWLIGKDPDAGKDWGQEEKETTEDEMVGWPYRLNGHECGWTPGVGDGQGGLACCSPWGRKGLDTTERLNWTVTKLLQGYPVGVGLQSCFLIFEDKWEIQIFIRSLNIEWGNIQHEPESGLDDSFEWHEGSRPSGQDFSWGAEPHPSPSPPSLLAALLCWVVVLAVSWSNTSGFLVGNMVIKRGKLYSLGLSLWSKGN